jgi:hypothetical protein
MKGSIKSSRNFMVIMALVLLAMNTQAQLVTYNATTLEDAYTTTTTTENVVLTNTGAMIISEYQEGAAIIKLENKFGLVNKQGYEICQPIYDNIHLFNGGYAAVNKSGKWTFVNKQGKKLTPLRYDWVGSFNDGLAAVSEDGKWGLLNEQGFEVVPTIYKAVKVDQDGLIWVQKSATWKPFDAKKNIDEAFVTAS